MARKTNGGVRRQTNLKTESANYVAKRDELRLAEIALMRQRERVAHLRRALPQGPTVKDYAFEEGPRDLRAGDAPLRKVRLSELFTAKNRAVVVYHFMYGKAQTDPCPLCTMWIDGYDAAAPHFTQNADFAVVAAAETAAIGAHAASRGWRNLRLLSAGNSTFKYDLGSEEADGTQTEWISVFTRDGDGTVRHIYSKGAQMADNRRERGIDLLSPVWNLLDLTPNGRGDWYPLLHY